MLYYMDYRYLSCTTKLRKISSPVLNAISHSQKVKISSKSELIGSQEVIRGYSRSQFLCFNRGHSGMKSPSIYSSNSPRPDCLASPVAFSIVRKRKADVWNKPFIAKKFRSNRGVVDIKSVEIRNEVGKSVYIPVVKDDKQLPFRPAYIEDEETDEETIEKSRQHLMQEIVKYVTERI
jgi:hypothetical protein